MLSGKELIEKAKAFAEKVHAGQTRMNKAKSPAITHMAEVAALVEEDGGSPEEVAAAWLHDTVEDTPTKIEEIGQEFGGRVVVLVRDLTDPPGFAGLPLLKRKIMQAEKIRWTTFLVRRVKIADQISNVRSIAHDPPVKWDKEKCLTYAVGALLIVHNCESASPYLYGKFLEVYAEALKVYL